MKRQFFWYPRKLVFNGNGGHLATPQKSENLVHCADAPGCKIWAQNCHHFYCWVIKAHPVPPEVWIEANEPNELPDPRTPKRSFAQLKLWRKLRWWKYIDAQETTSLPTTLSSVHMSPHVSLCGPRYPLRQSLCRQTNHRVQVVTPEFELLDLLTFFYNINFANLIIIEVWRIRRYFRPNGPSLLSVQPVLPRFTAPIDFDEATPQKCSKWSTGLQVPRNISISRNKEGKRTSTSYSNNNPDQSSHSLFCCSTVQTAKPFFSAIFDGLLWLTTNSASSKHANT